MVAMIGERRPFWREVAPPLPQTCQCGSRPPPHLSRLFTGGEAARRESRCMMNHENAGKPGNRYFRACLHFISFVFLMCCRETRGGGSAALLPVSASTFTKVLGGRGKVWRGEGTFLQKGSLPLQSYSSTKHRVRSSSVSRRRISLGVPSLVMSTSAARGRWL